MSDTPYVVDEDGDIRHLTSVWTKHASGEEVPCAFLDWSAIPGYQVVLVEKEEGDRMHEYSKIVIPAHQIEYVGMR